MKEPIRVFVVDDHPLVREWLTNLLVQSGEIEVIGSAANAREGLAAMKTHPPDVAIVDLVLPQSSGLDLIKDLALHLPEVRVVVHSMHEEIYTIERAVFAVANGRLFASDPILIQLAERRFVSEPGESVNNLSDRELEVFTRLGRGQSTRRIADDLQVSIKTVQAYCARIKEKLGLEDALELMRHAVRWVDRRDAFDDRPPSV